MVAKVSIFVNAFHRIPTLMGTLRFLANGYLEDLPVDFFLPT